MAAQFVLLGVLIFAGDGRAWNVGGIVAVLALLLMAAGLFLIVAAALQLGRAGSPHPEPTKDAVLRTDGLYRYVRHPIYGGVLLLAAGITLNSGSVLKVLAFVLLLVLLTFKARLEERMLRQHFPDYGEYADRTPAFLPKPPALFL